MEVIKEESLQRQNRVFNCDICSTGFISQGKLNRHKRSHTGERPYKCDICGKSFRQSAHLKEHISVHNEERPVSCDFCSKNFKSKYHLNKHIKWCDVNPDSQTKPMKEEYSKMGVDMTCSHCYMVFSSKKDLKVHFSSHNMYECQKCLKTFMTQRTLIKHSKEHSNIQVKTESNKNKRTDCRVYL